MDSNYPAVCSNVKNYLKNITENFSYESISPNVYLDIIPKDVPNALYIEHINEDSISSVDITGTKSLSFSFHIAFMEAYLGGFSKINYLESLALKIKEEFNAGNKPSPQNKLKAVSIDSINGAFIEEKNENSVIYKIKIKFNYLEVM